MRIASLLALLLSIPVSGAAAGSESPASDPPAFSCPPGTEPRLRAPNSPKGSLTATLSLVHTEKWCALPGQDGELRHGPYLALDRDGDWIEWGDYEAVGRNGVPDRRVGPWSHRTPGSCGDWVEWSTWEGPVRPTREQLRARPSKVMAAYRQADCGKDRSATGVQTGPGMIQEAKQEPHVALSKVCLAEDRTPEGPAWTWFANGEPRTAERQAVGVRHGEFRAWHSNGQLRWEGAFRQGREQGLWREFDCEGRQRCEGRAEGGRIVGGWQCVAGEAPPLFGWLGHLADPAPRP